MRPRLTMLFRANVKTDLRERVGRAAVAKSSRLDMLMSFGPHPDNFRRYAADDTVGFDIAVHHGPGRDDATPTYAHAVQHLDPAAEPDVVLDDDPIARYRLLAHRSAQVAVPMIARHDVAMPGDQGVVADFDAAKTVQDREGADVAIVPQMHMPFVPSFEPGPLDNLVARPEAHRSRSALDVETHVFVDQRVVTDRQPFRATQCHVARNRHAPTHPAEKPAIELLAQDDAGGAGKTREEGGIKLVADQGANPVAANDPRLVFGETAALAVHDGFGIHGGLHAI